MAGDGVPRAVPAYLAQALCSVQLTSARLEMFAQKAQAQGRPAEEALFRALVASLGVQAHRLTMLLRGKVGDTTDNLRTLSEQLLPGLIRGLAAGVHRADAAGQEIVGTALDQAVQVDSGQAELARHLVPQDESPVYYLCPICGWLQTGQAPEKCPVCGASGGKFQEVEQG